MKWRRTNKYLPSGKRVSNTFNQTVPPQLYRLGNPRDQMRCACVMGPDGQMCKRACTLNGCKSWTGTFETLVPTGVTGRAADGTTGAGTILVPGPAGTELRTCKGTPYRNPIAGYRKERICDCCVCSWTTVWTGTQQVENTTCPHGMPCPMGCPVRLGVSRQIRSIRTIILGHVFLVVSRSTPSSMNKHSNHKSSPSCILRLGSCKACLYKYLFVRLHFILNITDIQ